MAGDAANDARIPLLLPSVSITIARAFGDAGKAGTEAAAMDEMEGTVQQ